MSHASSFSSARGFTLVELLVVMALLGLMAALLFGGLRYTARTATHGTAVLDRATDLGLAANFLRSALADARPLPETEAGAEDSAIAFAGGAHRVVLIGAAPPHLSRRGFYRVEIGLDREKHVLAAHWIRLSPDEAMETSAALPASPLLDQVADAEFGYFGALFDEEAPSWHGAWEGQRALPSLVRLRVGFTDGSAAADLIVAVRTAAGALR